MKPLLSKSLLPIGLLFVSAAVATAAPQDLFEPNDDCTAPPLIIAGATTNLTLGPDDDYFTFDVPANADITVDIRDSLGQVIDGRIFEVGCTTLLATTNANGLRYFDCGGVARQLVLAVPENGTPNLAYSIDLSVTEVIDDMFEDNDSCSTGALVSLDSFTTPGLVVTGCDEDYFVARLQTAGIELQVDVLFSHAQGDVDIEIWNLGCTTLLASSTKTDDNESVRYVNATNPPAPQAVVVRIFMKNGTGWADYDLTACFGAPPLSLLGVQVCSGVVNSTGRPATLCGRGSDVAANNQVFLYVVDLPQGSAGYFITSNAFQFTPTPGHTMGNLCLGGPGRYSFNVLFTGATSAVFYQPNLTQTPVAGGSFAPVLAGERRFWQYWYRDSIGGMSTSNFSSALCVDFL